MSIRRIISRSVRAHMENYKGRHIGCAPGTHRDLVNMILRHLKPTSGVLDFGAHSGALLLRLKDAGFLDLTGVDLDKTRFDVPDAKFLKLELNQKFSKKLDGKYKLITATDVIEHLNSPREFLNEIRNLLEEDGLIAISLPNVAFWEGRIKFLLKGELWGFGASNYRSQRHISPVTYEQMYLMMQEVGFEMLESGTGGSFSTFTRKLITFPLSLFFKIFGGSRAFGESALYVAVKRDPDPDLRRPTHYRERWKGTPDRIGIDQE